MASQRAAEEGPLRCAVCGKEPAHLCSRCKSVSYCGQGCQKADWKTHRRVCFLPDAVCTRCGKSIGVTGSSPHCLVPHPVHLRESTGSMLGPDGARFNFHCKACSQNYTLSSSGRGPWDEDDLTVCRGSTWCYEGFHTVKDVKDDCRVFDDVVALNPKNVVERLLALNNDGNATTVLRVLKITNTFGACYGDLRPTLNIHLPAMKELQIEDVDMAELVLTPQTTPQLSVVRLQNVTEECRFRVRLPELTKFSIYYYGPGENDEWIIQMLEQAPKLQEFDSYKLRVDYLGFYSNHLRSVRLHRAEVLTRLVLWAPVLSNLDLQACYDLEVVEFLTGHPTLGQLLPTNFVCHEELHVNTRNACLGMPAVTALERHPRISHYSYSQS